MMFHEASAVEHEGLSDVWQEPDIEASDEESDDADLDDDTGPTGEL